MGLDEQNNTIGRASRFFVRFFAVLHDYHVKPPNFMFLGGREHMATWSEILAGNSFFGHVTLKKSKRACAVGKIKPFISYEYESLLWPLLIWC